jgi:ABC-type Fe3+-citrate transport system substrate-binding protein
VKRGKKKRLDNHSKVLEVLELGFLDHVENLNMSYEGV